MTRQFRLLCLVSLVATPFVSSPAQTRLGRQINAPISFAECGGAARYQADHGARFQPDSTLTIAPTDTVGTGRLVQFVVDRGGHVIPASLFLISAVGPSELAEIRNALPKWRFVPAEVGGGVTCQVVMTPLRRRLATKDH